MATKGKKTAKKSAAKSAGKPARTSKADEGKDGTLIIIGGREDRDGDRKILQEVARRAGSGKLVVATVATQEPDEIWREYEKIFHELGAKRVEHLDIRSREEALSDEAARIVEGANVVFFTGGDQLKITSQLGDSKVYQEVQDLLRRGGTVAGTSAGASVMSATMLVSGPGEQSPNIEDAIRMSPGLALLPDAVIDQHFAERGRTGRLIAAIAQNPRVLGIGIDEDTAIVVHDQEYFEVLGRGAVYVLDASRLTYTNLVEEGEARDKTLSAFEVKLHLLSEGNRFYLQKREPDIGTGNGQGRK